MLQLILVSVVEMQPLSPRMRIDYLSDEVELNIHCRSIKQYLKREVLKEMMELIAYRHFAVVQSFAVVNEKHAAYGANGMSICLSRGEGCVSDPGHMFCVKRLMFYGFLARIQGPGGSGGVF